VKCGNNIALICGKCLWFPVARLKLGCECNCTCLQWSLSEEPGSLCSSEFRLDPAGWEMRPEVFGFMCGCRGGTKGRSGDTGDKVLAMDVPA